jgi:tetratricopeptide (TPR) repeat protein
VTTQQDLRPDLLCLRGQALEADDAPVEAAAAFSAALAADPGCARAWALRGALAQRTGDLAGAIADLERARTLSDAPGIRFDLAVVYRAISRHDLAVELLDAMLVQVEDADARLQRAMCLLALGRAEEARGDLGACLAADSTHPTHLHGPMPELTHA